MSRRLILAIAVAGFAAQIGTLAAMIVRREIILNRGVVCRFRTAPVDPYDAFRGRYVSLSLETVREGLLSERGYARGQRLYARVGTDTNGFSIIDRLDVRPDAQSAWIKTRVTYSWAETREVPKSTNSVPSRAGHEAASDHVPTGKYRVRVALPFDRYYMEERLAPEAERAYAEASQRQKRDAAAVVRVWRGQAVLERLEVGGRPIQEVARERLAK